MRRLLLVVIAVGAFFVLAVVLIPLLGYLDGIIEPTDEERGDEPTSPDS